MKGFFGRRETNGRRIAEEFFLLKGELLKGGLLKRV
jgi:hypothetical protein